MKKYKNIVSEFRDSATMNIYQKIAINISKFIDELNNDETFKKENPNIHILFLSFIVSNILIKNNNNQYNYNI